MSTSPEDRNQIDVLADEFVERYRRGERPSISEFVTRCPELADEIREVFPALVMMEELAPGGEDTRTIGAGGDIGCVPASLGEYRIIREIGRGGMGVVYEAEQQSLGRRVAVKVLARSLLIEPRNMRRFEREARAAAKLHHTNIVPVFGVGHEAGFHYYVMQYIVGRALDDILADINRGRSGQESAVTPYATALPYDQSSSATRTAYYRGAARIALQVAEALQHAHEQGIVHRDIKPSNLLLDERGAVWVTDFGVAKIIDQHDLTHSGDVLGTLRYMAPEQLDGSVDARTDVYLLGLTLYEVLGLRPAFGEIDRPKLIKQVTRGAPQRLREHDPRIPCDLETIVHKAIEPEPSHRYQTADALADDLRRFLSDEPIRARWISPATRFIRWCKRNPTIAGLAATITVLVCTTAALGVVSHWRAINQAEMRLALQVAEFDRRAAELHTAEVQQKQLLEESSRRDAERRATEAESQRLEAQVNALVEEAQRISSGTYPDFVRADSLLTEALSHRPDDGKLYLFRGSARYELGTYETAISDLKRSLELQPEGSPAAHWLLGLAAQHMGDESLTRHHLEQARLQQPQGVKLLAVQALAMPYDARSLTLLTTAISEDPFDPLLHYYRGRIAYNLTARTTSRQHFNAAIDDLEKALRGRPYDIRIVETLCRCRTEFHFLADDGPQTLTQARQLLDQWLATHPDNISALSVLAQWQLESGQPEAAVRTCLRAETLPATWPHIFFHLGWAYRELKQHDQAVEAFTRSIDQSRQSAVTRETLVAVYAARATCHHALGREQPAQEDMQSALKGAPVDDWSSFDWYSVISAYRTLGQLDEGLQWSERFIQARPECNQGWLLRATLRADLNLHQQATLDFMKTIELSPGFERPYIGLLSSFLHLEQSESALEWCDRWLQAIPKSQHAYRWRGMFLVMRGNFKAALQDLTIAIDRDPLNARAYFHRARAYAALKQNDRAVEDLDRSLELNADDTEVYLTRGRVRFLMNRYAQAVSDLDVVVNRGMDTAYARRLRGDALQWLRRYDEALSDLNRSIELDATSSTAFDRRGMVHMGLKHYDAAVADFAEALRLNPNEPWTHLHIAGAYTTLKDYRALATFCDEWMRAEPGSSEPHRALALARSSMGDHQAALDELNTSLRKNAQDADALLQRGKIYAALGQHAKALADYNEAIELQPGMSAVYYSRGLANVSLNRFQAGIADFTKALPKHPTDAWLRFHRATAYRSLRQPEAALADCEQAIQLNSTVGTFCILKGRILTSQGDLDGALAAYMQAFKLRPGDRLVRSAVIGAQCRVGKHQAAVEFSTQWIGEEPASAEAYRHRALAHYHAGDHDAALRDLDAALQIDPQDYLSVFYRGLNQFALDQREQGYATMVKSIKTCPELNLPEHHGVMGEFLAELGEWPPAATHLAKSVELDPMNVRRAHLLALLQLSTGDEVSYQQTRRQMLQQNGQTEDPSSAELVVLTGILRDGPDTEKMLPLANLMIESQPDSAQYRFELGAVLYRTRQWQSAAIQLKEVERLLQKTPSSAPWLEACAASLNHMVHCRLMDREGAPKRDVTIAVRTRHNDRPRAIRPSIPEVPEWSQKLIAELLQAESEAMVADGTQ